MYYLLDKVEITADGIHKGKTGKITEVFPNLGIEMIYMVLYDLGNSGMFKHSELSKI